MKGYDEATGKIEEFTPESYEIDPILGKINLRKAFKERQKAMENEYEAFSTMHGNDGTFSKSKLGL